MDFSKIKAFVFDVDGVFTDATLFVGDHDVFRVYNVRDGYAVQKAARLGYLMAVISGGKQESIRTRLGGLGITEIHIAVGTDKKLAVLDNFLTKNNLKEHEVLFIGDDLPDLDVMKNRQVLACCPKDAVPEVLSQAHYVTSVPGGKGAVREVIECVLKAQGKWQSIL